VSVKKYSSSVVLVEAEQVVSGRAIICVVVLEALKYEFLWVAKVHEHLHTLRLYIFKNTGWLGRYLTYNERVV
jgi:hypothetical protein